MVQPQVYFYFPRDYLPLPSSQGHAFVCFNLEPSDLALPNCFTVGKHCFYAHHSLCAGPSARVEVPYGAGEEAWPSHLQAGHLFGFRRSMFK